MWQMYHKEKNTFIGLIKPVYQRITRSVDEAKLSEYIADESWMAN